MWSEAPPRVAAPWYETDLLFNPRTGDIPHPKVIAEHLGRSDISMTMDVRLDAADPMDKILAG
jgi:hypothetical protein